MKGTKWFLILGIACCISMCGIAYSGEDPFSDKKVTPGTANSGASAPLPPLKAGEEVTGTIDVSSSLNIRTSPWGDILGTLGPGAKVKIVGQVGDWYKIKHNGKTAFVHSAYVLRPGEKKKAFPRSGWVNSALGLNVRRVPQGDIIGKLGDQHQVEILGVSGDYYKIRYGDNEAFVQRKYIDTDMPSSPQDKDVEPVHFTGYVSAQSGLNVRTSPWGAIESTLPFGIAVQVTGKQNDWYRISYNGKTRWVHASYIDKKKPTAGSGPGTTDPNAPPPKDFQEKIARAARSLIGSKNFRGPEVDYGNKACAQVASTALVKAGAMSKVVLNVRAIVSDLHAKGWKDVPVPPFREGDVITWKTYDYTGDGVKDPDTHVGIMVKEGNTFQAMNNSSRLRTPRMTDPYAIGPITRVMRKV